MSEAPEFFQVVVTIDERVENLLDDEPNARMGRQGNPQQRIQKRRSERLRVVNRLVLRRHFQKRLQQHGLKKNVAGTAINVA